MRTVLVLTGDDDPTADAVIAELRRRPVLVTRLDIGDFPARLRLSAHVAAGLQGRLDVGDVSVELVDVRSVYYRRPSQFSFPAGLSDGDEVFARSEARLGLGGVLAALDAVWINDPMRVAAAEYKPLQLRAAARCGLTVPPTLVTNDAVSVDEFTAEHGPVVCKTLSSVVLSEGGRPQVVFTTQVDPATIEPAEVAATAHLFQHQVPKAWEARVTMVAGEPYAVAIHAGSPRGRVDWRADYDGLRYEQITPPHSVIAGMRRYLADFGLHYGAFDFVVDPDGRWHFLECNPAGQWLWLYHETGVPIPAALADALTKGADHD
jgi:ATP-grasp ribosomal peptide maturase